MGTPSIDQSRQDVQTLSLADVHFIIGRSSTLAERLVGVVIPGGQDRVSAGKRLACWKHLVANDDETVFRRVLAGLGMNDVSDEQLLPLLGDAQSSPRADLPPWAAFLQEIVPAISSAFPTGDHFHPAKSPTTNRSVPFAKLYSPIVAIARKKVETMLSRQPTQIRRTAWSGLESFLLERISAVCSLALQPRFLAYKAVRQTGTTLTRFEKNPHLSKGDGTASFFDAFVNEQGRQGLHGFFLDYPTAARLTAQVVMFWIDFVAEFLRRLDMDAREISARFADRRPIGEIVWVKAGISDPHHGGRSVLVLRCESGLRLVYKPRPIQVDAAFSDLLAWLNAQGYTPPLRPLEVLARENYGWEGFVEHAPCRNKREAKQFFQRAGALLYLVHTLRGIDLHRENVVATAQGPVLVDLEALCHPPSTEPLYLEQWDGEKLDYDPSIFRTGMLPIPARRPDGGRFSNLSALGGSLLQRSPSTDLRWKNINSDEMEACLGSAPLTCKTHRARLHGQLLSVHNYGEELANGFRRMSRFLQLSERRAVEWHVRAARMRAMSTRLIKRPTFLYTVMIRRSLQPRFLDSGVDRSIEFQALPTAPGDEDYRQAELAALEVLDIPAFFKNREAGTPAGGGSLGTEAELVSQIAAIRLSTAKRHQTARRPRRLFPHSRPH